MGNELIFACPKCQCIQFYILAGYNKVCTNCGYCAQIKDYIKYDTNGPEVIPIDIDNQLSSNITQ